MTEFLARPVSGPELRQARLDLRVPLTAVAQQYGARYQRLQELEGRVEVSQEKARRYVAALEAAARQAVEEELA